MEQFSWRGHPAHLEPLELEILERRDAFGLPPKATCNVLVDVFFKWISPILPVINRQEFMKRYHHTEGGPSILLLQAMFTVSSRFVTGRQNQADTAVSPRSFYKKAKALYDAGYEQDLLTVIQSVTLLGVYWDGLDGKISYDIVVIKVLTRHRSDRKWSLLLEPAGDCFSTGIRFS